MKLFYHYCYKKGNRFLIDIPIPKKKIIIEFGNTRILEHKINNERKIFIQLNKLQENIIN